MNAKQVLAVKMAERLLDALPVRKGATEERVFVARAAVILLDLLNAECELTSDEQDVLQCTSLPMGYVPQPVKDG